MERITTTTISQELADKVREKLKNTGFANLSGFVTFLLRLYLAESSGKHGEPLTKADWIRMKTKLRRLGYIK